MAQESTSELLTHIERPPEDAEGDGEGDVEMYSQIQNEFGDRLAGLEDDVLVRFVRGYRVDEIDPNKRDPNYNRYEITKERITNYLKVHNAMNFSSLLDQNGPESWNENFIQYSNTWQILIYGQNKFGHPIIYDRVGSSVVQNMRSAFINSTPETNVAKVQQYRYRILLTLDLIKKALRRTYNKMIYKHVLIFDMSGISASHFTGMDINRLIREVIEEEQHLFPETLHKLYLINSGVVLKSIWAVVSHWVDPITYEKVQVLGSNFLEKLTEEVSLDQIPQIFGGRAQNIDRFELLLNLEKEKGKWNNKNQIKRLNEQVNSISQSQSPYSFISPAFKQLIMPHLLP